MRPDTAQRGKIPPPERRAWGDQQRRGHTTTAIQTCATPELAREGPMLARKSLTGKAWLLRSS